MAALAESCASGAVPASVCIVIAPREDLPAVERARNLGLAVDVIPPDDPDYADRLVSALISRRVEYLCLAGYLRLLPEQVLTEFPNRVLNIHPALLPKYGGKGMYGTRVHEAVLAARDTESGCTVHLVNERYDEGRVLLQLKCPVLPTDNAEALAGRVLELELRAYPEALRALIGC